MRKIFLGRPSQIFVPDITHLQRHNTSGKKKNIKYGIDGLQDKSRKPHKIQSGKVTNEIEQEILCLHIQKDLDIIVSGSC